jgi:hypothetical protein
MPAMSYTDPEIALVNELHCLTEAVWKRDFERRARAAVWA